MEHTRAKQNQVIQGRAIQERAMQLFDLTDTAALEKFMENCTEYKDCRDGQAAEAAWQDFSAMQPLAGQLSLL